MIVCTKTVDTLARQAFGKNNVAISRVEAMAESFKLDPAISNPPKEAYIVTSDDIRNPKVRTKFVEAAAAKHKDVHIIFVVRGGKSPLTEGNGIDSVLVKPRAAVLSDKVYGLIEQITSKGVVVSSADQIPEGIEKYKPKEVEAVLNEPEPEPEPVQEIEPVVELDSETVTEFVQDTKPEIKPEVVEESEMVKRIQSCSRVADVHLLTKELTASRIVKDIVQENQQYAAIEEKLKAIQEKIYTIMADQSIKSLSDRLNKVRAILYDRDYYRIKNNTVVEQRVEEIIKVITSKTSELLESRLQELDKAIVRADTSKEVFIDFPRLAGITEERANLILELATLDKEVRDIFYATDTIAHTTSASIAEADADLTGNPLINAHLRVRGETVISEQSLDGIISILTTAERSSDEFKEAIRNIAVMKKKLNKLFDLDKETISAQAQIINYLQSNHIEDTVVAESLIKKTLRVFVGEEGTGRTVLPYVLSRLKSRQNANVLHIDITGTSKLTDYGCRPYDISEWMQERFEKDFCVVAGSVSNTAETAQRLLVALIKAADFYKVINIVMSPEQTELFNIIADDVLCVNYIVDTSRTVIDRMRSYMKETKHENVAQRVLINKCSVPCEPIIRRLDLLEVMDVNILRIPYIAQMVDCGLNGIQPYELAVVEEAFSEVTKYA